MSERTFTLSNGAGLHARPASMLVQLIQKFPTTEVTLVKGERFINGRSVLNVMSLGARSGDTITVRCAGPQADEALAAIAQMIEGGFGE